MDRKFTTPGNPNATLRELNPKELDQIVGGAAAPAPVAAPNKHEFDAVAGFDTSQMHLEAAALSNGQAGTDVAHAVITGQIDVAHAIKLLDTVATTDHATVTHALANFAGAISGVPGHAGDGFAVGAEISHLISTNQVTVTQAITDIKAAIAAHSLTADQSIPMLAGIAGHANATVQSAATAEIATLINNHSIPAAQAMVDIGNALTSHNLTSDQTLNVFVSVAAHSNETMQTAVGAEIATLIGNGSILDEDAITTINAAPAEKTLTASQAIGVLFGIAAHGDVSLQTAVGSGIGFMIDQQYLTGAAAAAAVDHAFKSHVLTGAQTVSILAGMYADYGKDSGAAAGKEFGSLIGHSQYIPSDQAISQLAILVASGTGGVQDVAVDMIAWLIPGGYITTANAMADIQHVVTSNILTGAQAISVLAAMAARGDAAVQASVNGEITSLVSHNYVTADQAVSTLAVTAMTGNLAEAQVVVAGEIVSLINNHSISVAQAMTAIGSALPSNGPDEQISLLASVAGHGNAAIQAAAVNEIARFISNGTISAAQALADIDSAMTAKALTANQEVTVLAGLAAHGDTNLQMSVGSQIASMIGGNQITAAAAMADIDQVVASNALSGIQAVSVLTSVAAIGTPAVQAAIGTELSSLINHNHVTADQAISALAAMAGSGTAAIQFGAGVEIASLISSKHITAAAAITDIEHAVTSNALTSAQALSVLASMAANGNAAVQTAVGGEIASLIDRHVVTANGAIAAMLGVATSGIAAAQAAVNGEIVSLINSGHLTADQAVSALTGAAASGTAAIQVAAGAEIGLLIGSNHITAATAITDIDRAVTSDTLTGAHAVSLLIGVYASGNAAVQAAAAGKIASLIDNNHVPVDQAIFAMVSAAASGNAAVLAAVGSEIASLISSSHTAALQGAFAAIGAATSGTAAGNAGAAPVNSSQITAEKAVSALIAAAANGTAAIQAAAASVIGSLVNGNSVNLITVMADIGKAAISTGLQNNLITAIQQNTFPGGGPTDRWKIMQDTETMISQLTQGIDPLTGKPFSEAFDAMDGYIKG